jgi:hypothetical protein
MFLYILRHIALKPPELFSSFNALATTTSLSRTSPLSSIIFSRQPSESKMVTEGVVPMLDLTPSKAFVSP